MRRLALALPLAGLLAAGVVAGPASADTVGPVVRSVSVSSSLVDVTRGFGSVTVTVRLTDADGVDTNGYVDATYTPDASADPNSARSYGELNLAPLTRVSGTATDGTYQAQIPVLAGSKGTWGLHLRVWDALDNQTDRTPAQLTAAGLTSSFRSTTTAAPATPTKLTGRTAFGIADFGFPVRIGAIVSWTLPVNSPAVAGFKIDAANASCGVRPSSDLNYTGPANPLAAVIFDKRTPVVPCRVTLRVANAAGLSGPVTVVFV